MGFYSFSIFFKPIQQEFNWSRGITSMAFTMIYLVQAAACPFIGRFTDRYGPKKVMTVGALVTGAGLSILSMTTGILHFYVGYAVTGLGLSAVGLIPVSSVISNWFIKRRGLAIGIAASGMGLGGFGFTPIVGNILIPSLGWRMTYQVLALFSAALIVMLAAFVIKTRPQDMGLLPDGVVSVPQTDSHSQPRQRLVGLRPSEAVRTSALWLIGVAFGLYFVSQGGATQHLVNDLTDVGFPTAMAVSIFSLVGLSNSAGKFMFGYVCDRLTPNYCAAISFFLELAATAMLVTLSPASNPAMAWIFAALMGIGIGGWAPVLSTLVSQNFGLAYYGAVYGMVTLFQDIGLGIGPVFYGYVYDVTGSYYWAYVAAVVLLSVAILLILILRPPKPTSESSLARVTIPESRSSEH